MAVEGPDRADRPLGDPLGPPAREGGPGRDADPPPRSRWPFRLVGFALAVTAFGAGIPTPLYSVYQEQMQFNASTLALIFGAYTLGVLVTMFLVSPLSDGIGRKPVLYLGLGLTAVGGVLFILASTPLGLAVARIASGLAVGATTGTATASMASLEPRADQHHVARVAVAANFGGVASGILLSGVLVQYVWAPTQLVFLVLVLVSALGVLAVAWTPETVRDPLPFRAIRVQRISVPEAIRVPFWISVGGLTACYSIYGLFAALAPGYLRVGLSVGNHAESAGVIAAMFGVAALAQLALGQVRDRDALLVGFPLLLVSLGVMVLSLVYGSLPLLAAAAILLGTAIGFAFMGAVTLVDRVAPSVERGEILSGFYLSGYLAVAIPTLGVAVAADAVGLASAGVGFGIALAAFAGALTWVTWRTPTPPGGEGWPRGRTGP